jgi:hypothetical protein
MITRRSFLGGMIAACAAPAIVRADSLMKIWVSEKKIHTWNGMPLDVLLDMQRILNEQPLKIVDPPLFYGELPAIIAVAPAPNKYWTK